MRHRRLLTRLGIAAAISAAAFAPAAGSAAALAPPPQIVVLGEWGDSTSCNAAADYNNTLGFPGEFACLLFRGHYYGIYVG